MRISPDWVGNWDIVSKGITTLRIHLSPIEDWPSLKKLKEEYQSWQPTQFHMVVSDN